MTKFDSIFFLYFFLTDALPKFLFCVYVCVCGLHEVCSLIMPRSDLFVQESEAPVARSSKPFFFFNRPQLQPFNLAICMRLVPDEYVNTTLNLVPHLQHHFISLHLINKEQFCTGKNIAPPPPLTSGHVNMCILPTDCGYFICYMWREFLGINLTDLLWPFPEFSYLYQLTVGIWWGEVIWWSLFGYMG